MESLVYFSGALADRGPVSRWTLPASIVSAVLTPPPVVSIPGAPAQLAGFAIVEAEGIPVFRLSRAPRALLLCKFESALGLLVDAVHSIGRMSDDVAPPLDLEDLLRTTRRDWAHATRAGEPIHEP